VAGSLAPLLSKRLNIITGKGGVGKSTVSAALALAAQARGLRVLCCEVTARERIPALLGAPPCGPDIAQVDGSIWSVHIRPADAMREYGLMVLRYRAVYSAVFENRLVSYFLRAVPSLAEIVLLGKVFWHVTKDVDETGRPRWDRVILDAPATGHGITFLRTPRTILELVGEGPMADNMRAMQAMLADPETTAVSVVTLPEEMPVNEAADLNAALRDRLELPRGRLFLNSFVAPRFGAPERAALADDDSPDLAAARAAVHRHGEAQDLSAHYGDRLRREIDLPVTRLPLLAGGADTREDVLKLASLVAEED